MIALVLVLSVLLSFSLNQCTLVSDVVLMHKMWYLNTDYCNSHLRIHYPIHQESRSTDYPMTTVHTFQTDYTAYVFVHFDSDEDMDRHFQICLYRQHHIHNSNNFVCIYPQSIDYSFYYVVYFFSISAKSASVSMPHIPTDMTIATRRGQ